MAWWRHKLYVGTGRSTYCVQQATLEYFRPDLGGYPPAEDDVECTPDPHDLPLQAEIWRWTPKTDTWEMVYRSPNDVPIAGTNPVKFTARDIGYRGMVVFQESDGTEALYVAGVSSRGGNGVGFNGPVPPPRILRSTDGVTFDALPQDPGTVLGDTTVTGFRNLLSYNSRMYVLGSVGLLGHGVIYEAANPAAGNDAFRVISPPGQTFFEIEKYNGHLYAGTGVQPANDSTPFSLLKTNATGDPYTFTTVIPEGAYKQMNPSAGVISLQPYKGRLYVGTDRELLRVNPDDSWDLVVGTPRATPDGRRLEPLSGFGMGFDNLLNIHMWRMARFHETLYVGTHDQSAKWRHLSGVGSRLRPRMGADLYASTDGWNYTMITRTGFGDLFNNGIRNFASTPYGLFVGATNHYYGTRIYRAMATPSVGHVPQRLAVESLRGAAVLSWEGRADAARFHVYRDTGFADPIEIEVVAATPAAVQIYTDATIGAFQRYHYFVVAEDAHGRLSGPSNMVRTPWRGPRPTFQSLRALLQRWSAPAAITDALALVRQAVLAGDYDSALTLIDSLRQTVGTETTLLPTWQAQDLDVLLGKFERRMFLAREGKVTRRKLMR
jgi:hypothetical protein